MGKYEVSDGSLYVLSNIIDVLPSRVFLVSYKVVGIHLLSSAPRKLLPCRPWVFSAIPKFCSRSSFDVLKSGFGSSSSDRASPVANACFRSDA
jgi:hypothetical protein